MAYALKPEFAPGSRWNYSNTAYVLLGILVGKASGTFYGDVLREQVFTAARDADGAGDQRERHRPEPRGGLPTR
jgi:CubicO group peptidase (beta-lactamase class C family)